MSLPPIDTNYIKQTIPMIDIVSQDVPLQAVNDYYLGPCPFCNEGKDRFKVWPDKQMFWCRRCERKGDVIQYAMYKWGYDFVAASKFLADYKVPKSALKPVPKPRGVEIDSDWREDWQYRLETMCLKSVDHLARAKSEGADLARSWLKSRGIGIAEIGLWGIGYNPHWQTIIPGYKLPPGILLPRYNANWELVAVNVYLAKEARKRGNKKMFVKGSSPNETFYNEPAMKKAKTIFITEGEFDCILLHKTIASFLLFPCPDSICITLGSANMMSKDLSLLEGKDIYFCFDNDSAGREAVRRWQERIKGTAVYMPEGKDITEYWQSGGDLAKWLLDVCKG